MSTRIVLVGGFLGAGKTTLLLEAAERLAARGYRVGMVTNDQGEDLVDTALGHEATVPVTEVAGGCFCCRFPDLLTSLQHLQEVVAPHVILAEPVGSCTDLVATVLRPLVQFYGEQYELAPLTVLLDGTRSITDFSPNVHYLYQQQLAEAELILLNKKDLLTSGELEAEQARNQEIFPQARVLAISAKRGDGLDTWLDVVLGQSSANPEALLIDYERYAEAEAALGWLNAKGQVRASKAYSPRQWITDLFTSLDRFCGQNNCPIAHVKTLVMDPPTLGDSHAADQLVAPCGDVARLLQPTRMKASLTDSSSTISWDVEHSTLEVTAHQFILNARVHTEPARLEQMAMQAIERAKPEPGARWYIENFECFSPLPPQPTYRLP
ncbi:MAG: GTP-binding protein [Chloroflexota bacterium]